MGLYFIDIGSGTELEGCGTTERNADDIKSIFMGNFRFSSFETPSTIVVIKVTYFGGKYDVKYPRDTVPV